MRMVKLAKYLPEYGWHPIVLTSDPKDCYFAHQWSYDPSLLKEVEGRSTVLAVHSPLERTLRALVQRSHIGMGHRDLNGAVTGPRRIAAEDKQGGVIGRIKRGRLLTAMRRMRTLQDQSALWVPFAYRSALRLIREYRVQAILTTSPPHLIHIAGLWLKRATQLPWIADFRDGWTGNLLFTPESRVRQRIDCWIERQIATQADVTVAVTEQIVDRFKLSYPRYSERFCVIHNGFDPADFPRPNSLAPQRPVDFVHVGSIAQYRSPGPFLRAMQELHLEGRLPNGSMRVEFVGQVHSLDEDTMRLLDEVVNLVPPVSHTEAIDRMVHAGVLLLFAGIEEGKAAFSGKVFEYLAARRPILAVVPAVGELASLLHRYPLARVASPTDIEGIKEGILWALAAAGKAVDIANSRDDIVSQFDRRLQAGRLAEMLDELCTKAR